MHSTQQLKTSSAQRRDQHNTYNRLERCQILRVPESDQERLQAARSTSRRPAANQDESGRQRESLAPNHRQNIGEKRPSRQAESFTAKLMARSYRQ